MSLEASCDSQTVDLPRMRLIEEKAPGCLLVEFENEPGAVWRATLIVRRNRKVVYLERITNP